MPGHTAILCDSLDTRDPATLPIVELANELARGGRRVTLLAPGAVGLDVDNGIDVRVPPSGLRFRWLLLLRNRLWFGKQLKQIKPDCTISMSSTLPGEVMIPMKGLLIDRGGHGLSPLTWILRYDEKKSLSSDALRAVVTLSGQVTASLRDARLAPHVSIQEAHVPIKPMQTTPSEAGATRSMLARALGLDPSAYWITFPFTRSGVQGLEPLLRAYKPLIEQGVNAVLLLAGPSRYTHLAWLAELGLREHVRFVGGTAHLDQLLPASDLVVYPADDPVGWGVRPALASGKPTITTDASALADAVRSAGGTVLASPAEPRELLEAIRAHHSAWQGGGAGGQNPPGALPTPDQPTLTEAVTALLAD